MRCSIFYEVKYVLSVPFVRKVYKMRKRLLIHAEMSFSDLKKKPNFNLFIFLGGPTFVDLGIYINSFYDISEQTMVSKTLHSYPLHPSPLFPPSEHPQ